MLAQWKTPGYNVHYLRLGHEIEVFIEWTSKGFKVYSQGEYLQNRFSNLDEAKLAGERLVRKILYDALSRLPDYPEKP